MKHWIKYAALLLALVLAAAAFSACGPKRDYVKGEYGDYYLDKDGAPVYELVMYDHGFTLPNRPEHREEVMAAINEKLMADLGFKVDVQVYSYSDDQFETKINTDIAGEKVIDLIRIGQREVMVNYVYQEVLRDLTDSVEELELDEMKAYLAAKNENIWKETSVDHRIYGIPCPAFTCYRGSWVRGDYLKKIGYEENGKSKVPATFAELEDALAKFKQNGVMSGRRTVSWAILLEELEGLILGNFTDTPGDFVDAAGTIKPKYYDPGYREFLRTVNEWYRNGYLDDQLFNATYDGVSNMLRDGNTAIAGSNLWGLEWGNLRAIDASNPQMDIRFMGYLEDAKAYQSTGFSTDILIIPYTSKNYRACLKFLNWAMYDEENYSLVYNGLEGVTYEKDGDTIRVPDAYAGDASMSLPNNIFGKFIVGGNVEYNIGWTPSTTPREAKYAYDASLALPTNKIYVPPTTYTNTRLSDELNMEKGTADKNLKEALQKIIKGSAADFDAKFNEMLTKYESDGGLKAYGIYTDIYKTLNMD